MIMDATLECAASAMTCSVASDALRCRSPPKAAVTKGNTAPQRATARRPSGPELAILPKAKAASTCATRISDVNTSTSDFTTLSLTKSLSVGSLEIGNNARES